MEKESKLGSEVVKVLRSDSLVNTGKEYLELGVDKMLESDSLKNIPFVNTVVGIFSAIGLVRDHMLANKLLGFLSQLSEISQEERIKMVERLNEDDKFSGRVGAAIIEILDRMESQKKPELAAKCFAAYTRHEISYEELRRVLLALERIPSFDIEKVKEFSEVTLEASLKMDESQLLAFVNAGLGKNNGGLDGGAIVPTSLCRTFVRIGIAS